MLGDHLGLMKAKKEGNFPEGVTRAVIHGNPDRVIAQAKLLDEPRLVARKRGFTTYAGKHESLPVLVSSTGMGSGSASIAIEELRELGIDKMIRVGTCGVYRRDMRAGDLVVPTSVLIDGPALRYLSPNYPRNWPLKDLPEWASVREGYVFIEGFPEVNAAITKSVDKELTAKGYGYSHKCFAGPVHDKDILHAWRAEYNLKPSEMEGVKEQVRGLTIATDMETGALFTISHMRGIRSGSILTVVNFSAGEEEERAQNEALRIVYSASLGALVYLAC